MAAVAEENVLAQENVWPEEKVRQEEKVWPEENVWPEEAHHRRAAPPGASIMVTREHQDVFERAVQRSIDGARAGGPALDAGADGDSLLARSIVERTPGSVFCDADMAGKHYLQARSVPLAERKKAWERALDIVSAAGIVTTENGLHRKTKVGPMAKAACDSIAADYTAYRESCSKDALPRAKRNPAT